MANYISNYIESPNLDLSNSNIILQTSPSKLFKEGLSLLTEISTASIYVKSSKPENLNKEIVYAHFDTGASQTSIDINLAKHLKLPQIGLIEMNTAGGRRIFPKYIIDISFINTGLNPFINLEISSCDLSLDLKRNNISPTFDNFGLLIGRDIMSHWHITWNGPSSTAIISD